MVCLRSLLAVQSTRANSVGRVRSVGNMAEGTGDVDGAMPLNIVLQRVLEELCTAVGQG